jgi:hypothetical protein
MKRESWLKSLRDEMAVFGITVTHQHSDLPSCIAEELGSPYRPAVYAYRITSGRWMAKELHPQLLVDERKHTLIAAIVDRDLARGQCERVSRLESS